MQICGCKLHNQAIIYSKKAPNFVELDQFILNFEQWTITICYNRLNLIEYHMKMT